MVLGSDRDKKSTDQMIVEIFVGNLCFFQKFHYWSHPSIIPCDINKIWLWKAVLDHIL